MARPSTFSPFFWHTEMANLVAQSTRMWVATGETASASAQVVGARMPIIESAMRNPLSANIPELSLMSSEKMEAFAQAQRAYWANIASLTGSMQAYWMDVMGMAMKAKPVGLADITRLNDRSVAMSRKAMGTAEKMGKPYHRTSTANAKRLAAR
jgi:hypothetical protein